MIVISKVSLGELAQIARRIYGNMIKAVVDVEREIIAIDGELHSDLEALLIEDGSKQRNLWGINLYPDMDGESFIEFDSMINVRPSQGNKSRGVEDALLREKIRKVVAERIVR